jgi:hypothetical protein
MANVARHKGALSDAGRDDAEWEARFVRYRLAGGVWVRSADSRVDFIDIGKCRLENIALLPHRLSIA